MNDANLQAILSAIRSVLVAIGSWFATKGFLDDATVQQLIGAVMVILPLIWGIFDKFRSENATKAREVTAINIGIIKADNTVGLTPLATAATATALIESLAPAIPPAPTEHSL